MTKINPEAKVLGIVVDCKTSNLNKILDSGAKVDLIYDNQVKYALYDIFYNFIIVNRFINLTKSKRIRIKLFT